MPPEITTFGILEILTILASIVAFFFLLVFGIVGLKTKQYDRFKKALKVFGCICATFLLLSIAWGVNQYVKQKNTFEEISYENEYKTFANESSLLRVVGLYTDELGFSLRLPPVPKDTFAIKKETYSDLFLPGKIYQIPMIYIRFTVDASNTTWVEERYEAFQIIVYPRVWWNEHVTVDSDGYLLVDGLSDGIPFETFAGKNDQYAFTFSSPIECPLSLETGEETWQCEVAHTARQTVLPTIKVY